MEAGLAQAPAVIAAVLIGAHFDGIVGVALARVAVAIPFTLINWWWVRKVLRVELRAIGRAVSVPLLAGAAMFGVTELLAVTLTPLMAPAGVLLVQIAIGGAAYTSLVLASEVELRTALRGWLRRGRAVTPAVPSGPNQFS